MIPVASPSLTRHERKALLDAYDTGYIGAKGAYLDRFEEKFAYYHGLSHGVACASGTAALHLALTSLGIGRDCEVIVPALTFVATKNAVLYQKAIPQVVDVDPLTWNLDISKVKEAVSSRTKAIIAVHLYGNPCDMEPLMKLCADRHIALIEDCAESIGSLYQDKLVGTFSTVSCFSFFGNKTMTTGQGGMVLTDSKALADRVRYFANQAMLRPYEHQEVGFNYRMTNLQAAIGCSQLKRLNDLLNMKEEIAQYYRDNLHYDFQTPCYSPAWWMNAILVDKPQEFMAYMLDHGIETRPGFKPMSDYCQTANKLHKQIVLLPSGPVLSTKQLKHIVEVANGYQVSD